MWIYEEKDWPNFNWDNEALSELLAETRFIQGKILGRMSGLGFSLQQEAQLNTLTRELIQSSAIEGELLNLEEVRSSVARKMGIEVAGLVDSGRDTDALVEMMMDATINYKETLSQGRLYSWHAALFPSGYSGVQKIDVAQWRSDKNGQMQVVSGGLGNEKVHFTAPDASQVAIEMNSFLAWLNSEQEINPLIKAGIAHLYFLSIHPFEDGNGRIARAISEMLLCRSDDSSERFYSLSSQIEEERKEYYRQLEAQQRSDLDITLWLKWFISCLQRSLLNAEKRLATTLNKAQFWGELKELSLNPRQNKIINLMLDDFKGHLNTSKYAKLAKCSKDTALRDITHLLNHGILKKNSSGGRSTSYCLRGRSLASEVTD